MQNQSDSARTPNPGMPGSRPSNPITEPDHSAPTADLQAQGSATDERGDIIDANAPAGTHATADDFHDSGRRFWVGVVVAMIAIVGGGYGLYRIGTAEPTGQSGLTLDDGDSSSAGTIKEASSRDNADQESSPGATSPWEQNSRDLLGAWDDLDPGMGADSGPMGYTLRPNGYAAISRPNRTVPLAFVVPGLIDEVLVQENDVVVPGQPLIRLDDSVQQRQVEAQELVSNDRSELEAALARHEMAVFDLEATYEAKSREATSPRDEIRVEIEERLRSQDIEAARRNLEQAKIILAREQARLDQMTIRSSIDGLVVEISAREGQAVDAYEPIMVVVSINPLWLSVPIPMQLGLHVQEGDEAVLHWRDLPNLPPTTGRVLYVSPVTDASSNQIMVRIEVENPDNQLPSGLHALVQFPDAVQRLKRSSEPGAQREPQMDARRTPDWGPGARGDRAAVEMLEMQPADIGNSWTASLSAS
ncbi:MAG: efflux RND transporter periplasmic adaptor subunit [Planctomycetota bacterium]